METEQNPTGESSSQTRITTNVLEVEGETQDSKAIVPAKLPAYSRAAAAQRLNDVPERPVPGTYYAVPHLQPNPPGWRTKRHLKRKNLRLSNMRYAATDRTGVRWAMLPMALGSLAVIVILSSVFITGAAIFGATQERYSQQVTTLEDIIPQDSLKAYDT